MVSLCHIGGYEGDRFSQSNLLERGIICLWYGLFSVYFLEPFPYGLLDKLRSAVVPIPARLYDLVDALDEVARARHLIDNEDLSLFLRFLSWSMSTIYIYVWMMLCALYTKVELNMLFPFIGNIISSILFVSMAGISYIITLKVIRTYHKLTTKSSYWKRKGNTHFPISCGFSLTFIIIYIILSFSH